MFSKFTDDIEIKKVAVVMKDWWIQELKNLKSSKKRAARNLLKFNKGKYKAPHLGI